MAYYVDGVLQGQGGGGGGGPLEYQYSPDKVTVNTARGTGDRYARTRVQGTSSYGPWFALEANGIMRVRTGERPAVNASNFETYDEVVILDDDGHSFQVQVVPQHETAPQGTWADVSTVVAEVVEHLPTATAADVGRFVYSFSFHSFHQGIQNPHNNRYEWQQTTSSTVLGSTAIFLNEVANEETALSRITLHSNANTYYFIDTTTRTLKQLDNTTYVAGATIATSYPWISTGAEEYQAIGELLSQVPSHVSVDPPTRSVATDTNFEYPISNEIRDDIERFRNGSHSHVVLLFAVNLQRFGGSLSGNATLKLFAGSTDLGGITAAGGSIGTSATSFMATVEIDASTTIPANAEWKLVYDNDVTPINNSIQFSAVSLNINYIYSSSRAAIEALLASMPSEADKTGVRDKFDLASSGLRSLVGFSRSLAGGNVSVVSSVPNATGALAIPQADIQAIQGFQNGTGRNLRVVQRVVLSVSNQIISGTVIVGIRQGSTNKAVSTAGLGSHAANDEIVLLVDTTNVDFSGTDSNWSFFLTVVTSNPGGSFTWTANLRAEVVGNTELSPTKIIEALDDTSLPLLNEATLQRVRNYLGITFQGLSDTPSDIEANRYYRGNSTGTAIEQVAAAPLERQSTVLVQETTAAAKSNSAYLDLTLSRVPNDDRVLCIDVFYGGTVAGTQATDPPEVRYNRRSEPFYLATNVFKNLTVISGAVTSTVGAIPHEYGRGDQNTISGAARSVMFIARRNANNMILGLASPQFNSFGSCIVRITEYVDISAVINSASDAAATLQALLNSAPTLIEQKSLRAKINTQDTWVSSRNVTQASGTPNTIRIEPDGATATIPNGREYAFIVPFSNTGAVTLEIVVDASTVSSSELMDSNSASLTSGDIDGNGIVLIRRVSGEWRLVGNFSISMATVLSLMGTPLRYTVSASNLEVTGNGEVTGTFNTNYLSPVLSKANTYASLGMTANLRGSAIDATGRVTYRLRNGTDLVADGSDIYTSALNKVVTIAGDITELSGSLTANLLTQSLTDTTIVTDLLAIELEVLLSYLPPNLLASVFDGLTANQKSSILADIAGMDDHLANLVSDLTVAEKEIIHQKLSVVDVGDIFGWAVKSVITPTGSPNNDIFGLDENEEALFAITPNTHWGTDLANGAILKVRRTTGTTHFQRIVRALKVGDTFDVGEGSVFGKQRWNGTSWVVAARRRRQHILEWTGARNPLGTATLQLDAQQVRDWANEITVPAATVLRYPDGRLIYCGAQTFTGTTPTIGGSQTIVAAYEHPGGSPYFRPHLWMGYFGLDFRCLQQLPVDFNFEHWEFEMTVIAQHGHDHGFAVIVGGNRPDIEHTVNGYDRGLGLYFDTEDATFTSLQLRALDGTTGVIPNSQGTLTLSGNLATAVSGSTDQEFHLANASADGYPHLINSRIYTIRLEFHVDTLYIYFNEYNIDYPYPRAVYQYAAANNPFRAGANIDPNLIIHSRIQSPFNTNQFRILRWRLQELETNYSR